MPKFPKNTSSFMKYSKKGSAFPFKSPVKNDMEKIPTLSSEEMPTNTKMGYGNRPIDFERGGYGQKLDPKRAGFPGDYIPKKDAKNIR